MIRGIALDGCADWIFAPLGWDADALQRQFAFSGESRAQLRTAMITPSQLKDLVSVYGETPTVALPRGLMLSRLMRRSMLAVEILIARDQEADSTMPL